MFLWLNAEKKRTEKVAKQKEKLTAEAAKLPLEKRAAVDVSPAVLLAR